MTDKQNPDNKEPDWWLPFASGLFIGGFIIYQMPHISFLVQKYWLMFNLWLQLP